MPTASCRLLGLFCCLAGLTAPARAETMMRLRVDARDLPRKLLHSTIELPVKPGPLKLWYPRWIPGSHGPFGRVEDIGGLTLRTPQGAVIAWKRDEVELNCFHCDIPADCATLLITLDTICNVAAPNAVNVYSYGTNTLGVINWNTALLYPDGVSCDALQVELQLQLPNGWKAFSALQPKPAENGVITHAPVSLAELIDSPLIAGKHTRQFKLEAGNHPPAYLDLVGESDGDLNLDPKVVALYSRLVQQACALFGTAHYREYHFLVTCSDALGDFGLEHHQCSLNGVKPRDLIEDGRRRAWTAALLPHEYAHSWCGKYRRPAGMCVDNFHTPQKTRLVWVYEGLTEYLGEILSVRSGLISPAEYREWIASNLSDQLKRKGRTWRSLEDTATANHQLRAPSNFWSDLRRDQDFYSEGSLLWWEVDVTIRRQTQGRHSLDDFCRDFMGKLDRPGKVVPYELDEILAHLNRLAPYDWKGFFTRRVALPMERFPVEVVAEAGYTLGYRKTPSGLQDYFDRGSGSDVINARDSVGLTLSPDGQITGVVIDSLADRKGLRPGVQQILGVNGKKFNREQWNRALEASVQRQSMELLLLTGEDIATLLLPYGDGPRYLELTRDEKKPDLLAEILKAR